MFLLAIWFDKIPDKTLIWYAIGDDPVPEGSKVELTSDGHFTLTSPKGQEVWKPQSAKGIDYAAMLDTGNFVLTDKNSNYLWESFKDPTDTILPTQVLEIGGNLSSRQTVSNYSNGIFQLQLQTNGNLVLNAISLTIKFPYKSYFESNTADGADEMNSGYQLVFDESGYINVILRNKGVVNLTKGNNFLSGDHYYRATLDFDGVFTGYAHPKAQNNGSWLIIWSIPDDICSSITSEEVRGPCGFNSYCRLDANQRPICNCLPGFSLVDSKNNLNGCKQDRMLKCELGSTKPEDLYEIMGQPLSEDDCRISCLYDCNCVIAVFKGGSCHKKKLPVTNGQKDYNTDGKALIKIPRSDVSADEPLPGNSSMRKKNQSTIILVGALLLGSSVFLNFLFAVVVSLFVFYAYQKRQKQTETPSFPDTNICKFTYADLKESTDEFREELGRGSFGTVYKGVLSTSSSKNYVAVKKLDKILQDGEKEFRTEVSVIAKTHHKNLVRLLGFCDEGPNKLLVYEFMANGTLASLVFGISRPDWNKQIQLAFGIARGLTYLHEECSTQIIHCDIKPQNILLDYSFTARISDFGLAKLLLNDQTHTQTTIRGTRGYVAPEWFRNIPITAKVDVYSSGVMLLEVISCRKSLETERENDAEMILTDWAYDCYKEKRLHKLVEHNEMASNDMKTVERLVMLAIWCVQEDPSIRPSMRMVTQMLEGVVQVSQPPCPSSFGSICKSYRQ